MQIFQRNIQNRSRMCQCSAGNIIYAKPGQSCNIFFRHISGNFNLCPSVNIGDGFFQRIGVHIIQHEDDEVEKELTTIVDLGGTVEDVFVYHKVYGVLRAEMNIKSRMDIRNYMEEIRSGKSSLLKNVTSGYHYHTVRAERVEILDMIQEELQKKGLLAKLQDYEPVDFWGQNNYNE